MFPWGLVFVIQKVYDVNILHRITRANNSHPKKIKFVHEWKCKNIRKIKLSVITTQFYQQTLYGKFISMPQNEKGSVFLLCFSSRRRQNICRFRVSFYCYEENFERTKNQDNDVVFRPPTLHPPINKQTGWNNVKTFYHFSHWSKNLFLASEKKLEVVNGKVERKNETENRGKYTQVPIALLLSSCFCSSIESENNSK